MASAVRSARLYGLLLLADVRSRMQYRANYILLMITILPTQLLTLAFVWMLVQRFGRINGWGFWELAFLNGLIRVPQGIGYVFRSVMFVENYILAGTLDKFLLRPRDVLCQTIAERCNFASFFGEAVPGLAILAASAHQLRLAFGALDVLYLAAALAGGTMIYLGLMVAQGAACFFTLRGSALRTFMLTTQEYTSYPLTIYHPLLQLLLTFVLPFAFINFYPAHHFFRPGPAPFAPWLAYLTPALGAAVMYGAWRLWRAGLARYQGAGS
ncbi:MAG: ABC-2 family transporter protein [Acetobacteraceae bacterium]|nr:ABC-2 family transporter protein [Acetobacteraceae bacterium]